MRAISSMKRRAGTSSSSPAWQASSALKSLAGGETVQAAGERVQAVDDRTYFLREGVWTDSTYAGEETLDIAPYSAARLFRLGATDG